MQVWPQNCISPTGASGCSARALASVACRLHSTWGLRGAAHPGVREAAIFKDLEHHVEHVWVGLLNLIKEHHSVGPPAHSLCQLATLVVAHVACDANTGSACRCWHALLHVLMHHVEDSACSMTPARVQLSVLCRPVPVPGHEALHAASCRSSKAVPGGDPMSLETVCLSMYSDMSKRTMASTLPK